MNGRKLLRSVALVLTLVLAGVVTGCVSITTPPPDPTVTFDAAGGTPETVTIKVRFGARVGEMPAEPVRQGYIFLGWYTQAEGEGELVVESMPIRENTRVHAHWTDQIPFIFTIRGDEFTLPLSVRDSQVRIDWGDGTVAHGVTAAAEDQERRTHRYDAVGEYEITLSGVFNALEFSSHPVIDVKQWGTNEWTWLRRMFSGSASLEGFSATDAPDLSAVESLAEMFRDCTSFNGAIGHWDVSTIKDMSYLFAGAAAFNQDIGRWDLSSLDRVDGMFQGATAFNQDIGDWDTSKLFSTNQMFKDAESFNQDLNRWNTSNLISTIEMFAGAVAFDGEISQWDMRNVVIMEEMFRRALAFNGEITSWDVSNLRAAGWMFEGARAFDQDLSRWDIQNLAGGEAYSRHMFSNSGLSPSNYSAMLIAWEALASTPRDIWMGAQGIAYLPAAETSRQRLLDEYGWVIEDAGPRR